MSLEVVPGQIGCIQTGIIQHEVLHALGFMHEQSRADRDCYVWIDFDAIQDGRCTCTK